ncbi:ataxin-2 homolog [Penaeus indicus]|uniref:ataxin-2 homolog n=1 Tax=Penaeus indicus TaxID=29960 RepID=UPI00300C490F
MGNKTLREASHIVITNSHTKADEECDEKRKDSKHKSSQATYHQHHCKHNKHNNVFFSNGGQALEMTYISHIEHTFQELQHIHSHCQSAGETQKVQPRQRRWDTQSHSEVPFELQVLPKPLETTMQTQQSQQQQKQKVSLCQHAPPGIPAAAAPATICEPPPPSVSLGHHPDPPHHLPAWPDAPPPPAPPSSLADGGGASTASPRRSADAAGD